MAADNIVQLIVLLLFLEFFASFMQSSSIVKNYRAKLFLEQILAEAGRQGKGRNSSMGEAGKGVSDNTLTRLACIGVATTTLGAVLVMNRHMALDQALLPLAGKIPEAQIQEIKDIKTTLSDGYTAVNVGDIFVASSLAYFYGRKAGKKEPSR